MTLFSKLPIMAAIMVALVVAESVASSDATVSHEQISCQQCHLGASGAAAARDNAACLSCHREQLRAVFAGAVRDSSATARCATLDFHNQPNRDCTSCHTFHRTALVSTSAGPLDLVSARQVDAGHCTSCHAKSARRENLNSAHLQAAALYHTRSAELIGTAPSAGCLSCHDRNSASAWKLETAEPPLTFSTHASHRIGTPVIPGAGPVGNRMRRELDPRIPLFGGQLECQTCHSLTATTKDLLVDCGSTKALCLGCHQLKSDNLLAEQQINDPRTVLLGSMAK
jgi:predicted CXXCH cytochrome family protein